MSMKCKHCKYEMTTFEFLGHISAQIFLVLKERLQTRSVSECWSSFMAGFATEIKIACPLCKSQVWVPEFWQGSDISLVENNGMEHEHAE